jgi:hypothetical protein
MRGGGTGPVPEHLAQELALAYKTYMQAMPKSEMAVALDGFIKQTIVRDTAQPEDWDVKNNIAFNLQLLNTNSFEQLLGLEAPSTPMSIAR